MSESSGESARPSLGGYLREQRIRQGLSQAAIAARGYMSKFTVFEIEMDESKANPRLSRNMQQI